MSKDSKRACAFFAKSSMRVHKNVIFYKIPWCNTFRPLEILFPKSLHHLFLLLCLHQSHVSTLSKRVISWKFCAAMDCQNGFMQKCRKLHHGWSTRYQHGCRHTHRPQNMLSHNCCILGEHGCTVGLFQSLVGKGCQNPKGWTACWKCRC